MGLKENIYTAFNDLSYDKQFLALEKANQLLRDLLKSKNGDVAIALKSYDEAFVTKLAYNSNAIEGSTLSEGDTADVLDGHFIADKDPGEQLDARGIADGHEYVLKQIEQGRELSEELIKDIHERTALTMKPETRGTYRTGAVYIRGSDTVPPPPLKVRDHMADLFYAYNKSKAHPLYKIAAFHTFFENVHPFRDGNGRAGRNLMNFMLLEQGYLPVALRYDKEHSYLNALNEWAFHNKPELFLKQVSSNLALEIANRSQAISTTLEAQVLAPEKSVDPLTRSIETQRAADRACSQNKATHDITKSSDIKR